MSNIALSVHNISKSYRIVVPTKQSFQKNRITGLLQSPFRYLNSNLHPPLKAELFWALKDVSFEINQGEVLGIIGKNGAGKSTLLKIISRIVEPTDGKILVYGRIASLLEVGTGFHPELTGRENIYLSGAILGMKRKEIDRKYDNIVAFSELEKFLNTPVKRYSSGMYVRLAFAVAAHLDPDILLVDEVLAVGDIEFQKKCLGAMGDVARGGRTVLLVSHNMNQIRNLSNRCLLLEKGKIAEFGAPEKVITRYLTGIHRQSTEWIGQSRDEPSLNKFIHYLDLNRFALVDENGNALPSVLLRSQNVYVQIEGSIKESDIYISLGFCLFDGDENHLMLSFQTDQPESDWPPLPVGDFCIRAKLDMPVLNEGKYRVVFTSNLPYTGYAQTDVSVSFELNGNASISPYWIDRRKTIIAPILKWERL